MKKVLDVRSLLSAHWVGDGFEVRNLLAPGEDNPLLSPFLLLDYLGPTDFEPAQFEPGMQRRGVGEHPHRGFETVTLLFEGAVDHRDSAGNAGSIGPGDVQWMTAGAGVVHEELHGERFTLEGGTLHGVQLWVNLPRAVKMTAPAYQDLSAEQIPTVDLDGAGSARVIAGELRGEKGPARTHTAMNLWDVHIAAGREAELSVPEGHNTLVALLHGRAQVAGSPEVGDARLVLLDRSGAPFTIAAQEDTHLLVLTGEPIPEPIAAQGPFVMNTRAELFQAIEDYKYGRMGSLT